MSPTNSYAFPELATPRAIARRPRGAGRRGLLSPAQSPGLATRGAAWVPLASVHGSRLGAPLNDSNSPISGPLSPAPGVLAEQKPQGRWQRVQSKGEPAGRGKHTASGSAGPQQVLSAVSA